MSRHCELMGVNSTLHISHCPAENFRHYVDWRLKTYNISLNRSFFGWCIKEIRAGKWTRLRATKSLRWEPLAASKESFYIRTCSTSWGHWPASLISIFLSGTSQHCVLKICSHFSIIPGVLIQHRSHMSDIGCSFRCYYYNCLHIIATRSTNWEQLCARIEWYVVIQGCCFASSSQPRRARKPCFGDGSNFDVHERKKE